MLKKKFVGVSACLLGCPVRYNGASRLFPWISGGLANFAVKPVCPEFECGLSVPHPALRLEDSLHNPKLVFTHSKEDLTEQMLLWAERRLALLKDNAIVGFVFKSNSPSCGLSSAEVFDHAGKIIGKTSGLWTALFQKAFPDLPVADENELSDHQARIKFLKSLLGK